jgi:dihydrofolate synthase/folylpolyglutamate synthase
LDRAVTEDEAIAYLFSFINYEDPAARKRGPGFTLDGMRCLLDLLEHPERAYPSVVVAGSKGKGSTSAMLASILSAAGHRTGLYTQPHLHHWRERARVDGRPLPPEALAAAVERLRAVVPILPERCPAIASPTYYELGTAVALLYFASLPVDVAVLEIGLGGRLDAVNTVTPLVSAITAISLEHTDVLGATIEAIAGEKAGIIKPGVPVVVAPQPAEAAAVFERVAAERGAPLIWAADRVAVEPAGDPSGPLALAGRQAVTVTLPPGLRAGGESRRELELPLLGAHQLANAATAVAVAEALAGAGLAVGPEAVTAGLSGVAWPGRLEVLRRSPLLIADGAHNPESAGRLREALASHFPGRRMTLILGVLNDKDIPGIAAELVPAAARVLAVSADQARAAPVEEIVAAVAAAGGRAEIAPSVAVALDRAFTAAREQDMICVTGSLMTVAEARSWAGRRET